ncbi:DUF2497 domain-containing protein [Rhizobium sp. PAMB 3182]
MAQPNVAREPSMEEILASIRKIIENNDPESDGQQNTSMQAPSLHNAPSHLSDDGGDPFAAFSIEPETPPAPRPHADIMPAPVAVERSPSSYTPSMSAANQGAPARMAPQPVREAREAAPQQADPSRNLSLADVAARVRAASERNAEMMRSRAPEPAAPEPVAMREPTSSADKASESPAVRPSPVSVSSEPKTPPAAPTLAAVETPPAAPAPVVASETVEAKPAPVLVAPVEAKAAPAMPAVAQAPAPNRGGLISAVAGQQVARSFEDLAQAVDGAQKRSLDEIAEEMLRPMLQDWLDNNLPSLVERLVREEIERVARGPRR